MLHLYSIALFAVIAVNVVISLLRLLSPSVGCITTSATVDGPLKVVVDGPSIIVSMLGTDFSVTYSKAIRQSASRVDAHVDYRERACAGEGGHPSV